MHGRRSAVSEAHGQVRTGPLPLKDADITVPQALAFASGLFSNVHTDGYPRKLIESLRRVAEFDFYAVVHYSSAGNPSFLFDNLRAATSPQVVRNYVSDAYRQDVAYVACRNGIASGLHRTTDLATDRRIRSDLHSSVNVYPCVSEEAGSLAEEIIYFIRGTDRSYIILSLMRAHTHRRFEKQEFSKLSMLEPVVRETITSHWRTADSASAIPLDPLQGPAEELEQAFSEFAQDSLSCRELTVVKLFLKGHSTLSVALNLNISEGTVKIHRKNIYEKLNINSQAQLFLLFCEHIVRKRC